MFIYKFVGFDIQDRLIHADCKQELSFTSVCTVCVQEYAASSYRVWVNESANIEKIELKQFVMKAWH